jgi:predicted nucleic acid-binding Zn ribbon protein
MIYKYVCSSCGHSATISCHSSDSTILFCPFCAESIDEGDSAVELDYRDEFEADVQDSEYDY